MVREATAQDASAMARLHVRAWRSAYRGLLPDDVLDGLSVDDRTARWRAILAGAGAPGVTTVACDADGAVVGLCSTLTPSRDADADPRTAELAALYVDPANVGTGAGAALLSDALARLRASGWEAVTLWVLDGNDRATRFYAAFGFAFDGSRADAGAPESRMRLALR